MIFFQKAKTVYDLDFFSKGCTDAERDVLRKAISGATAKYPKKKGTIRTAHIVLEFKEKIIKRMFFKRKVIAYKVVLVFEYVTEDYRPIRSHRFHLWTVKGL